MVRRKLRRKKNKKQIRIVLGVFICLLLVMTVGYAAFSTNISLTAKGNIKKQAAAETLKKKVVTSADGLYVDSTEEGRYIYRGTNPDNYITFNNEKAGWRIVSVENDGTLKIIKNDSIGYIPFDVAETRNSSTSTYCVKAQYGCNAWAATKNLIGSPSVFTLYFPDGNPSKDTTAYSGTVIKDASLNTYLNNDYYTNSLGDDKKYIVNHDFYVGTPGSRPPDSTNESLQLDVSQEKLYVWNGKIGLITATDYIKASTTNTCTSIYTAWPDKGGNCGTSNWLKSKVEYYWTISPRVDSSNNANWIVSFSGELSAQSAGFLHPYSGTKVDHNTGVLPTLFLSKDITLSGKGTEQDPYTID